MKGPVITVDVSKGSCHYQPFLEKGAPFRKPKVLHDTIEGFADLETIIQLEDRLTQVRYEIESYEQYQFFKYYREY